MEGQPKITDMFKTVTKSTPKNTQPKEITTLRKRPLPAIFENDPRRQADEDVVEVDEDGIVIKRKRIDNDPNGVQMATSQLSGWKKKKKNKTIVTNTGSSAATEQQQSLPQRKTWAADGFHEWLTYMKKKWSKARSDRKAHKRNALTTSSSSLSKGYLNQLLAYNRERIQTEYWHIIQITETKTPGIFDVFALVDGNMRRFSLNIPRIIYVNDLKERAPAKNSRKVEKILPKMQFSHNLYEYSIDEQEFTANINEFNKQLCAGNILGIYETQIPLLFRAFVHMGATCRINSLANTYRLEQFERVLGSDVVYADIEHFHTIFFYEYSHGSRTVFGLISPKSKQGYVFIVNKARIDLHNFSTVFSTEYQKFVDKRGTDFFPVDCENIQIESIQTTTIKDATKQISNIMKSIRTNLAEPFLITLQTSRSTKEIMNIIPALKEFPNVRIRVDEPSNLMNALEWGNQVGKRIIQHFMNSFVYLADYWTIAHYVGIPVGNLPEDVLSLALDVFYARALQQHNHVLWASRTNQPDYGGKEADDLRFLADWENVSFKQHHGRVVNFETFEQKNCIAELEIGAVAVNALIQNVRILKAEGASTLANARIDKLMSKELRFITSITDFDEDASLTDALKILRHVFHELIKDIHLSKNFIADQLVVHMYRWMCDPKSLMYNPAIVSNVNTLMRKLCSILIAEINQLGANVIYCSFSRIILSTGFSDAIQSRRFVSSLITSLSSKPIFAALQIAPLNLWNICLWIDPTNYAAIGFHQEDKENDDEVIMEEKVVTNFAMIEKLPEKCKKAFCQVTTGYMMLIANKMREDSSEEALEQFCQNTLSEELNPRLFQVTDRLIKIRHILNTEYREANLVDGEEDSNFDVAVEFVKAICKALSLDKHIAEPVENLRSQLLQMLSTNLPPSALEWRPPTYVCVLENLFCHHCSKCVDLDLCAHVPDEETTLRCTFCNTELSKTIIEELLIGRLSKMVTAFVLQDRKCVHCKQLATRSLAQFCECSNKLEFVTSKTEFMDTLRTIRNVSKRHELSNVQLAVQWEIDCYSK